MSGNLKAFNHYLDYKLHQLQLFGKAELRGPVLNVNVQHLRGATVDTEQLLIMIRAAVEASMISSVRKVAIRVWSRNETEQDPEWVGGFELDPMALMVKEPDPRYSFRRDYAGMRVLFFGLAFALIFFFLNERLNPLYLLPCLLSLGLGIGFPMLKRWVDGKLDPLSRRIGLGVGILLAIGGLLLVWKLFLSLSILTTPLLLLAILLIGLGL